jgi:hypothetical protein
MTTKPLLSLAAFSVAFLAGTATIAAAPIDPHHPLVGTWTVSIPGGRCIETYVIRADGTTLVTSADEVAESEFEVAPKPSKQGFYKWADRIVKDNGKKDCGGAITPVGRTITHHIRFSPDEDKFIICQEESLDACFGPFIRQEGDRV